MNKHILIVIDSQMNPDKYTQEQLDTNADAAYTAYVADYAAAAAYAAYAAYDAAIGYEVEHYLDKYFRIAGESKQGYIDTINKDNK